MQGRRKILFVDTSLANPNTLVSSLLVPLNDNTQSFIQILNFLLPFSMDVVRIKADVQNSRRDLIGKLSAPRIARSSNTAAANRLLDYWVLPYSIHIPP